MIWMRITRIIEIFLVYIGIVSISVSSRLFLIVPREKLEEVEIFFIKPLEVT